MLPKGSRMLQVPEKVGNSKEIRIQPQQKCSLYQLSILCIIITGNMFSFRFLFAFADVKHYPDGIVHFQSSPPFYVTHFLLCIFCRFFSFLVFFSLEKIL